MKQDDLKFMRLRVVFFEYRSEEFYGMRLFCLELYLSYFVELVHYFSKHLASCMSGVLPFWSTFHPLRSAFPYFRAVPKYFTLLNIKY